MKWFKHLSTAMDDLFVKDLERKFSHAGYAFWFKTLELIAAHGRDGELVISWENYTEKLAMSRRTVTHLLRYCASSAKLVHISNKDTVTITCFKFKEYADNYSTYGKKSLKRLQSDFKETSKQEEEVEEEVEQKKKRKSFVPPTPDEASAYFTETLTLPADEALAFIDHYTANGWVQGRQGKPVKDWRAAARNWKRNYAKFNSKGNANGHKQAPAGSQAARASFKHGPGEIQRLREFEATLRERDSERDKRS